MSLITQMLRQTAVYWSPEGVDGFGQPKVGNPVEIACRWEDGREEIIAATGERKTSRAKVYVGVDVIEGGILMPGTLAEVTDPLRPKGNRDAWEIVRFEKVPNLRATEYLRTAYLGDG